MTNSFDSLDRLRLLSELIMILCIDTFNHFHCSFLHDRESAPKSSFTALRNQGDFGPKKGVGTDRFKVRNKVRTAQRNAVSAAKPLRLAGQTRNASIIFWLVFDVMLYVALDYRFPNYWHIKRCTLQHICRSYQSTQHGHTNYQ